jgi:hypothetical protein
MSKEADLSKNKYKELYKNEWKRIKEVYW